MLFDDFPELLNANYLPASFKVGHADELFLLELHLLIRSDTIYPPLQLICNPVHIRNTSCSGLSLSSGWTDLKSHTFVSIHFCHSIKLFLCSFLHLNTFFPKYASGTGCLSFGFLQ
jgi:hypothetical protein